MKVLIVDDESFVRRSLSEMLGSANHNFSIIGSVENGLEAIQLLKEQTIDLVISDIRMPGMDGLELSKHIHECHPDTETILLTGYQDFSYASQAIRYGVREYLVKPNSVENILEVVTSVYERLELKKQHRQVSQLREKNLREKRLSDLLYGIPLPYFEEQLIPPFHSFVIITVNHLGDVMPQYWSEQAMYAAVINILEECFSLYANVVGIQEEQEAIIMLFYPDEQSERIDEALTQEMMIKLSSLLKSPFSAGVSNPHYDLGALATAYHESLQACQQLKKDSTRPVIYYSDVSMCSASPQLTEQLQVKATRRVISMMIEAMNSRLQENLSLKMIADELYMNPTYLGRLFKDDVGECFSSFLTKLRIQKAIELLNNVTLKVYEVSELVGFKDPAYFSLIFKKYMGMTPQEFQKHNK
ncbi:response regulator [Paenibacillus sp. NPDC101420]|uniref:response regulator transcription factor n=1 Tax=Paenibacillus sp. NPDC101420 TaxID=3390602 RepID=UPI003D05CBDB